VKERLWWMLGATGTLAVAFGILFQYVNRPSLLAWPTSGWRGTVGLAADSAGRSGSSAGYDFAWMMVGVGMVLVLAGASLWIVQRRATSE
jgi:hypothetical protein